MQSPDRSDFRPSPLAGDPGDAPFDTDPPDAGRASGLAGRARSALTACVLPLMRRGARGYVGGETVADALSVARRWAESGAANTLGYWPASSSDARAVADVYLEAIAQTPAAGFDSYLSIKPPALRYDAGLAAELADAARAAGVRLHCDSHGAEAADATNRFAEALLGPLDASDVGVTLPGRWTRSLKDADWAIDRGLRVRVVKGQWPDPDDPGRDLREGFIAVIDRLADRARHVAVATHDLALARDAADRLRATGTPCALEMIHGMPVAPLMTWAAEDGLDVRIYVPFGPGYIPNALGILRRNPRLAWRIVKGLVAPEARP